MRCLIASAILPLPAFRSPGRRVRMLAGRRKDTCREPKTVPRSPAEVACAARRRRERRHHVVGRRTGGHRLAGRDRQARAGDRRLSERRRSGARGEVRVSAAARHPRLAWDWFRDNPVGFNGVPFVLFKTILDLDPNHENPTLRTIARIWKREAPIAAGHRRVRHALDARSPRRRSRTRPTTWTAWRARRRSASRRCRSGSRSRTRARSSRCRAPRRGLRRAAARATRVPEHEPADRQAADRRPRRQLGEGSSGVRQPGRDGSRVLLVRRVPRRPRRGDGKMKFLPGMPNTEIEAQYYSKLLMLTGGGAGRVGLRSDVHDAGQSRRHQAQHRGGPGALHRDAGQGAAAAGDAVRLVAGARSRAARSRRWPSRTSSRA